MKKKILIVVMLVATMLSANAQGKKKVGERQPRKFDIEQTISYGAQVHTIAFSALAFFTGTLYSASFYPPGKVADFFGFQYMRDNDVSESGHNTDFLTKAAWNTMNILNTEQVQKLIDLASEQESLFRNYALGRLVLIDAFYRNLNGDIPKGKSSLDVEQVKNVSRDLYLIDAEISYGRALTFAQVINSLTTEQVAALQKMGNVGMRSWTMPERPKIQIPRGLNVWVMSNASEIFSWYLRGLEADVYFCPERQGTYFGGFYMKDAPAVGNAGYAIDPQATSSKGASILKNILTTEQARQIRSIYDEIKIPLESIVKVREDISTELRKALAGKIPDKDKVKALFSVYGELDCEYNFAIAKTFAKVGKTLSADQKKQMIKLRDLNDYPEKPGKVFIYSTEVDMPKIPNSDFLFK